VRRGQAKRAAAAAIATAKGKPDPSQPGDEDVELLILQSMADPSHRALTVQDRCELMGISRATWYRHTADPLFRARVCRAFRDACGDHLGPVLQALCESAVIVGKDGHSDRKLFLELVGQYEPGASRRTPEEQTKPKTGELSDAELLALFDGRQQLLPPGVQRRLGLTPTLTPEKR
jgi:hypothetical protein